MLFFFLFLAFLILQRIGELFLAKRNERIIKAAGGIEFDKKGYKYVVMMHIVFFLSLASEKLVRDTMLSPMWFLFLSLFICAQILRYWAIVSLGKFWNTKIFVVPNVPHVTRGPYRFMHHPNYLAVVIEIVSIPSMFSCYVTAMVFTIVNFFLLMRRVRIENRALGFGQQKGGA